MKVQIETVKKYLKQYASFNYDEFIFDSWLVGQKEVSLDELKRMLEAATKKTSVDFATSEIVYLFYKASFIDETVAKYDTTVDIQIEKEVEFDRRKIARRI